MKTTLLAAVLLAAFAPSALAQGGRLQQVREAARTEDKSASSDKDDSSSSDSDEDNPFGELFAEIFGGIFLAPFYLPHHLAGDEFGNEGWLPHYPYQVNNGFQTFENVDLDKLGPLRGWAGRFAIENGNDFDGLNRVASQLFFETASRFGVQARVELLTEDLDCGCTDHSWLSSYELTYRFAQTSNIHMYAGLGLRVFDDAFDTHYGWNFVYGADIFPAKPCVLSLSLDAGSVGETGLFRARGTVGYLYRGFETYAGYDHLNIGGVELGTWLAGIRLWF